MPADTVTIRYGKREQGFRRSEWWRTVWIDDGLQPEREFRVGHYTDGKPRKIAYRGGQRGFWWYGEVYHEGRSIWTHRVGKSLGVEGILKAAGIIDHDAQIKRCGIPARTP